MNAVLQIAADLQFPIEAVTECFAILANRGAGKSATATLFVEQLHQAGQPVVVLDIKGDWWGLRSSRDGKGPGLPFVIFGGDHGDVPLEPTAGALLADLVVDDHVPAVLDLSHMSKTKARTFTIDFAERLYHRNRSPLHVVVEEADVLIPQRASAETARLLGAMEDIAKRGRSRGIGLTLCSQRAQEVSKSVLDLMETVILLRTTGPRSIKAVRDWIEVNAAVDENTAEVIASLPTLETGEAWVWSPSFLGLLQRVRVERFTTFDSHATPKPGQRTIVPRGRADIDLDKLGAEIAATAQRARDNDPKELRARVEAALREVEQARLRVAALSTAVEDRDRQIALLNEELTVQANTTVSALCDHSAVENDVRAAADALASALGTLASVPKVATGPDSLTTPRPRTGGGIKAGPQRRIRSQNRQPPNPRIASGTHNAATASAPAVLTFRAGAQRMLESLARMAPLHLARSQWGMVSRMKHTSGTFSTYLSELRRAGLIEENAAGFTVSEAGFDYLGVRPEPMSATELQDHYLRILRSGASRMLAAVIAAYPQGLTRAELAGAAEITSTSGTFSTYLSELRRNSLIVEHEYGIVATDLLINGAPRQDR